MKSQRLTTTIWKLWTLAIWSGSAGFVYWGLDNPNWRHITLLIGASRRSIRRTLATILPCPAQVVHDVYEADDLVATAAYHSTADTIFVVSGDKDLQQRQGRSFPGASHPIERPEPA
jgi:hypothetical protein